MTVSRFCRPSVTIVAHLPLSLHPSIQRGEAANSWLGTVQTGFANASVMGWCRLAKPRVPSFVDVSGQEVAEVDEERRTTNFRSFDTRQVAGLGSFRFRISTRREGVIVLLRPWIPPSPFPRGPDRREVGCDGPLSQRWCSRWSPRSRSRPLATRSPEAHTRPADLAPTRSTRGPKIGRAHV